MPPEPLVSVVMGVFNESATLAHSLDSLLEQEFTQWEAIVVDDGSQDDTREILTCYSQRDDRIRPILLDQNGGLTLALNLAIAHARGEYIARLDGDEQCLPHRLARQVAVLSQKEQVVMVGGGWMMAGKTIFPPHEEILLRWHALFANPFSHGTIMFRRLCQGQEVRYDNAFPFAQDYELWSRLLAKGEVVILPDPPLLRRINRSGGISMAHKAEQYRLALTVAQSNLNQLLPGSSFTLEETARLRTASTCPSRLNEEQAKAFRTLLTLFGHFVRHISHKERLLVGHHLVKSILDAVDGENLPLAWRTGILWDVVRTLPHPLLSYALHRVSSLLTTPFGHGKRIN